MDVPEGQTITRDAPLSLSVAEAKLAATIVEAGHDFRAEWAKSLHESTNTISEKFSHCMTGDESVVVKHRVPKENGPAL